MNLYEARLLQARIREAKEAAEAEALVQKDQTVVIQYPEVLTMEDIVVKDSPQITIIPANPVPEIQFTLVPDKEVATKPQVTPVKEVASPKQFKKKIGEK